MEKGIINHSQLTPCRCIQHLKTLALIGAEKCVMKKKCMLWVLIIITSAGEIRLDILLKLQIALYSVKNKKILLIFIQ